MLQLLFGGAFKKSIGPLHPVPLPPPLDINAAGAFSLIRIAAHM